MLFKINPVGEIYVYGDMYQNLSLWWQKGQPFNTGYIIEYKHPEQPDFTRIERGVSTNSIDITGPDTSFIYTFRISATAGDYKTPAREVQASFKRKELVWLQSSEITSGIKTSRLAYIEQGNKIVSSTHINRNLPIKDSESFRTIKTIDINGVDIYFLSSLNEGANFISIDSKSRIVLWNSEGTVLRVFKINSRPDNIGIRHKMNDNILTYSESNKITFFNIDSRQKTDSIVYQNSYDHEAKFNKEGNRVLILLDDEKLELRYFPQLELLNTFEESYQGIGESFDVIDFGFIPNTHSLFTMNEIDDNNSFIQKLSYSGGSITREYTEFTNVTANTTSTVHNSTHLILATNNAGLSVFDFNTRKLILNEQTSGIPTLLTVHPTAEETFLVNTSSVNSNSNTFSEWTFQKNWYKEF